MKFLAGLVAAFLIAAGLSVGAASSATAAPVAVSADPYGPNINMTCKANFIKPAQKTKIKIKFAVRVNGAKPPKTKVVIKVRDSKGKVVRTLKRKTRGYAFRYMTFKKFKNKPGRYTVSMVATPRGADAKRYKPCSTRINARVKK